MANKYFKENKKLAYSIIKRFRATGILDWEDIKQLALIGLFKASENYDPRKGIAFSTYAYQVMRNEILTEINKTNRIQTCELNFEVETQQDYNTMWHIIRETLSPKEAKIIKLHCEGFTQKEISKTINISQSQISRVFIKAKDKIRVTLNMVE